MKITRDKHNVCTIWYTREEINNTPVADPNPNIITPGVIYDSELTRHTSSGWWLWNGSSWSNVSYSEICEYSRSRGLTPPLDC